MSDVVLDSTANLSIPLTVFAMTFDPGGAIADLCAPQLPVTKKFGPYPKYDKKSLFASGSAKAGVRGQVDEIKESLENGNYACLDYAKQIVTPVDAIQEYGNLGINKEQRDTKKIMTFLAIERESRAHTIFTTPGNYPAANQAAPLAGTWNLAASTPLQDGAAAIRGLISQGRRKVMIMSRAVFDTLKFNAQVLSALGRPGGQTDREISQATKADIARMFEVDDVLVSDLKLNTANDAQTMALDYVWNAKHVAVVVAPLASDLTGDALAFAITFRYLRQNLPEMSMGEIPVSAVIRRWFDNNEGAVGSWRTLGTYAEDISITAPDAGFLITNVIP